MKKHIHDHYRITKETMILAPAKQVDSSTLVMEVNEKMYVKQTALNSIKKACLEDGFASYDGRREAAIYLTTSKKMVPIAINPYLDIFAFPTHSPSHKDCHWVFYNHIRKVASANNNQSIVSLSNGEKILLPISIFSLKKRMYLTSHCILQCKKDLGRNQSDNGMTS